MRQTDDTIEPEESIFDRMCREKAESEAKKVSEQQPKTRRTRRELEVIPSDRLGLIHQANRFIEIIIAEYREHPRTLIPREQRTYKAALAFLERQFEQGYRDTEVVDKRIEKEEPA
jgi:hypothetical protein